MLSAFLFTSKSSHQTKKENAKMKEKETKDERKNCKMQAEADDIQNEKKILINPHPFITQEDYQLKFAMGDVPMKYWNQISKKAEDLNGRWQILVHKSDSMEDIMRILGYTAWKRKIMSVYPSIADFTVTFKNDKKEEEEKEEKGEKEEKEEKERKEEKEECSPSYPVISITTHFPMSFVKKGVVEYNGRAAMFHDSELGGWLTTGCFIEGRAMQRREGEKGLMFDTRVVFNKKPSEKCEENQTNCKKNNEGEEDEMEGPMQLLYWTYIPHDTGVPIVTRRWFKKID